MVTNGHTLRIVDCSRIWTRQAVDFDFAPLLTHASGVVALAASGRARQSPLATVAAESERHSARVCHSLGNGVLAALPQLIESLRGGKPSRGDKPSGLSNTFEQALTARLSRPVPAVRRSARARAGLERRLSRRLHIDALCRRMTRAARRAGPLGLAAGDLAHGAHRLPCRRAHRHAVQRPAVLAVSCAARRAAGRARRDRPGSGAVSGDRRIGHRPAPHRVPRPRGRAARFGVRARARVRGGANTRGRSC